MVYDALRPEMPRLSLGTVYRNLQQMSKEGRVRELGGAVARYDADLRPHTHFSCRECGRVVDAPLAYDPALDAAASADGWTVTGHSLVFHGICPACAELSYTFLKGETLWN